MNENNILELINKIKILKTRDKLIFRILVNEMISSKIRVYIEYSETCK